ncbi:hypothetical protein [Mammaliicoccus sciuri]|uniref:hypothetical protein n=1 Tax=Mammaliicoccus sciuri TaxID=1296 RepID=UPI0021CF2FE8|nr:hypothetical protein [Mammaliicoccus sciuri]UXV32187.1 hypothetical protein MUA60_15005 [Mammaliicoccus sciuri]
MKKRILIIIGIIIALFLAFKIVLPKTIAINQYEPVNIQNLQVKIQNTGSYYNVVQVELDILPNKSSGKFNPYKDFAMVADGKNLKLHALNDKKAIAKKYKVTGYADSRWIVEYEYNERPTDLKFQIIDRKLFGNKVYEYNMETHYLR